MRDRGLVIGGTMDKVALMDLEYHQDGMWVGMTELRTGAVECLFL